MSIDIKIKFESVYKPVDVYLRKEFECIDEANLFNVFNGEQPKLQHCHYNAMTATKALSIWGTPVQYVEGLAMSRRKTYHFGMIHAWNKTTDDKGNIVYFDVTPLGKDYDYIVLREFMNDDLYQFQDQYKYPICSLFVVKIGRYYEYYTNDGVLHRTTRLVDANTAMDNELPNSLKGLCWEYTDNDGNIRKRRPTDNFNII